jgi:hypothetical protein
MLNEPTGGYQIDMERGFIRPLSWLPASALSADGRASGLWTATGYFDMEVDPEQDEWPEEDREHC